MFRRKYKYYIAYNYKNVNGTGFGSCDISGDKPIKTSEDMNQLVDDIKKKNDFNALVILTIYKLK